jgi:fumarate hydratase subunit alpha
MSRSKMLKPADGVQGVIDFVVETVSLAGPNPCPPIVVGVGVGGTIDKAAQIAKKALTREIGSDHEDAYYDELEHVLIKKINALGIGPQGLGGRTTCIAVHIEAFPTHIAGLPVVVNINCHAARHLDVVL